MAKAFQKKHFKHSAKSARTYKNKQGKQAYHGTRYLKGTQILGDLIIHNIFFVEDHLDDNHVGRCRSI